MSLDQAARRLEDLFFHELDRELIRQLAEIKRRRHAIEALAEASGIRDRLLLEKLVDLHVGPEAAAALVLVPLVEVAWADGGASEKERDAVLRAADESGVREGSMGYLFLVHWLTRKPPRELSEAWDQYVWGLNRRMNVVERSHMRKVLLEHTHGVASAAGGLLGLVSPVSDAEQAVLDRLEGVFNRGEIAPS